LIFLQKKSIFKNLALSAPSRGANFSTNLRHYIQLHEFEALLFTKWDGFEFCGLSASARTAIQEILQDYPNPELINDHPQTAPSKRLIQLFAPAKYKKPFHGNFIALENGFEAILEKCPRFKTWIDTLEKRLIP
jgi:Domain of unknown function (DUF4276)